MAIFNNHGACAVTGNMFHAKLHGAQGYHFFVGLPGLACCMALTQKSTALETF